MSTVSVSLYDLGLSPATTKNPSKASVSFWIYTQNPKWGMRSAAEKYYALNPASFTTSADDPRRWALASDLNLSSVPNPEDFGWAFQEGTTSWSSTMPTTFWAFTT